MHASESKKLLHSGGSASCYGLPAACCFSSCSKGNSKAQMAQLASFYRSPRTGSFAKWVNASGIRPPFPDPSTSTANFLRSASTSSLTRFSPSRSLPHLPVTTQCYNPKFRPIERNCARISRHIFYALKTTRPDIMPPKQWGK